MHRGIQNATILMSCSHHLGLGTHDTLELLWKSLDCGSCHKCENQNSKEETKLDEGIVESLMVTKPYEEMEKIKKKFWTYTGSKTGKVSNLELLVETICVNMCVCVYTFFYWIYMSSGRVWADKMSQAYHHPEWGWPAIEHSGTGSKTGYWQICFCSCKF